MRKRTFLVPLILTVILSLIYVAVYAGTISLRRTGATSAFSADSNTVPRDDGALQVGAATSTRFTRSTCAGVADNDGDCVQDELTGLIWYRTSDGPFDWFDSLVAINALNVNSQTDFRMPNLREMESLLNSSATNSAQWLNTQGFSMNADDYVDYWVSNGYANQKNSGWAVRFTTGAVVTARWYDALNNDIICVPAEVGNYGLCWGDAQRTTSADYWDNKNNYATGFTYYWHYLAVRSGANGAIDTTYPANISKTGDRNDITGSPTANYDGDDGQLKWGVAWPGNGCYWTNDGVCASGSNDVDGRFATSTDGTMTDGLTGLMWVADFNCIKSYHSAFDSDGSVTWQTALNFIKAMNAGTYDCNVTTAYTDWRLPNRQEMWSLLNEALSVGHSDQEKSAVYYLEDQGALNMTTSWSNYWTSTIAPHDTGKAYHQRLGLQGPMIRATATTTAMRIWPVRSASGTVLTVEKSGSGTGAVTVTNYETAGDLFNCGATCTDTVGTGIVVKLKATSTSGSGFKGWVNATTTCILSDGTYCRGTGDCIIPMNQAQTCEAQFDLTPDKNLIVDKTGDGIANGYISTDAGRLYCGSTCSAGFTADSSVILTATTTAAALFNGWGGATCVDDGDVACTGLGTCEVFMDQDRTCEANFLVRSLSITANPTSIAFGSVNVGNSAERTITVANTGNATSTIDQISALSDPFSIVGGGEDNCSTTELGTTNAASRTCTFKVGFDPTSTGASITNFNVSYTDDGTVYNTAFSVSGTGITAASGPDISVSANRLSGLYSATTTISNADGFLSTPSATSTPFRQTVTVSNYGDAALSIDFSEDGTYFDLLAAAGTACYATSTVAAAGSCDITVRYNPLATGGPHKGTLTITSNDPDEASVKVKLVGSRLSGSNALAPTAPVPSSPANGATNLPTNTGMRFTEGTDATAVTHTLYFGTEPSFTTNFAEIVTASAGDINNSSVMYAGFAGSPVIIIALFGIVVIGGFVLRKRKKTGLLVVFMIVLVIFTGGLLMSSCGGGGGGSGGGAASGIQTGLSPNTTYYWKVQADDGNGGISESDTYSYRTGPS